MKLIIGNPNVIGASVEIDVSGLDDRALKKAIEKSLNALKTTEEVGRKWMQRNETPEQKKTRLRVEEIQKLEVQAQQVRLGQLKSFIADAEAT